MFKGESTRTLHEQVNSMDRKIDGQMWGFAKEAIEEDLMQEIKDASRNEKWTQLRVALMRAKWNPVMVEAALKGVKPFMKTSSKTAESPFEPLAAFRFYHQMLVYGKERTFAVLHSRKHVERLLKCTQKTTNGSLKQSLAQYMIDWIAMFDGLDPCLEFHRACRELPVTAPHPSPETAAFKKELHDQYYADKDHKGREIDHLGPEGAQERVPAKAPGPPPVTYLPAPMQVDSVEPPSDSDDEVEFEDVHDNRAAWT